MKGDFKILVGLEGYTYTELEHLLRTASEVPGTSLDPRWVVVDLRINGNSVVLDFAEEIRQQPPPAIFFP